MTLQIDVAQSRLCCIHQSQHDLILLPGRLYTWMLVAYAAFTLVLAGYTHGSVADEPIATPLFSLQPRIVFHECLESICWHVDLHARHLLCGQGRE
jgi:hypothetical protein